MEDKIYFLKVLKNNYLNAKEKTIILLCSYHKLSIVDLFFLMKEKEGAIDSTIKSLKNKKLIISVKTYGEGHKFTGSKLQIQWDELNDLLTKR